MPEERKGQRLEIVFDRRSSTGQSDDGTYSTQRELFPEVTAGTVVFVEFPAVQDQDLVHLMEESQPSYVFDLRLVPRFDLGKLTRQKVFELFEKVSAKYIDTAIRASDDRKSTLESIGRVYSITTADFSRPVVFILGSSENSIVTHSEVLEYLEEQGHPAAEVLNVPNHGRHHRAHPLEA